MSEGAPEFPKLVTETGCSLQVLPAGSREDYALRGLRILTLTMEQPGDHRRVEVRLTPNERAWLAGVLTEGWL